MATKVTDQFTTPQRWFQSKRLPLYAVVGGTIGTALYLSLQKNVDPRTTTDTPVRKDPLHQVNRADTGGQPSAGGSGMREGLKSSGMLGDGHQHTDGIFPNAKIAEKLGNVMGTDASNKGK